MVVYLTALLVFQTIQRRIRAGIATGYGLDDKSGRSSSPDRVKNFLLVFQTGSGPYPASFPMGTEGSFPEGKAAEA
jgi:hypothetical protein